MRFEAIDYLYFDLALLGAVMSFAWPEISMKAIRSRRFWAVATVVLGLWFVIDQIALSANIWYFPAGGTLPIRIARLPIEEWLGLIGHTIITWLVLRSTLRPRGAR